MFSLFLPCLLCQGGRSQLHTMAQRTNTLKDTTCQSIKKKKAVYNNLFKSSFLRARCLVRAVTGSCEYSVHSEKNGQTNASRQNHIEGVSFLFDFLERWLWTQCIFLVKMCLPKYCSQHCSDTLLSTVPIGTCFFRPIRPPNLRVWSARFFRPAVSHQMHERSYKPFTILLHSSSKQCRRDGEESVCQLPRKKNQKDIAGLLSKFYKSCHQITQSKARSTWLQAVTLG